jgi:hypothetical protein
VSLKSMPDPFYAKNAIVRVRPSDSNSIHPLTKPLPNPSRSFVNHPHM